MLELSSTKFTLYEPLGRFSDVVVIVSPDCVNENGTLVNGVVTREKNPEDIVVLDDKVIV